MNHRAKFILLILCALLLAILTPAAAKDDLSMPVAFAQTETGVVFYGFTADNTLAEIGHLPDSFSLEMSVAEWHLAGWWGNNIVLSPDGQFIAFTAHRTDQTGLFIYEVATGEIREGFADDFGDWIFYLHWSPDSTAILSRVEGADSGDFPVPPPETMVYELETGELRDVTNNLEQVEFNVGWASDSQSIAYTGGGTQNGVMVADRDGESQTQLVNFETDPPLTGYADACDYTWSAAAQRWYYVAGCPHYGNAPWDDRIYSVDLQGNFVLEADFPVFYEQQFQNSEGVAESSPILNAVSVHALRAVADDVYAVVNLQTFSIPSQWIALSLSALESPLFTYEIADSSQLATVEFSPDNQYVALADNYGLLVVGDVRNGTLIAEISFQFPYPFVRWLTDNFVLYRSESDVWMFSVSDDKTTNLSAALEHRVFLLPQTNSVWLYVG